MGVSPPGLALAAGAALLAATKLWAGVTGDLAATMATAGDDAWGVASLVMLYSGLAVMAGLVLTLEPRRPIALGVIVAMPLIGNMAPALWLAWRGLPLISSRAAR
jgi:hypothetical protein